MAEGAAEQLAFVPPGGVTSASARAVRAQRAETQWEGRAMCAPLPRQRGPAQIFRRRIGAAAATMSQGASNHTDVKVMVNGLPGKMALATAEAVLRRSLTLVPYALTGDATTQEDMLVGDDVTVQLIKPAQREATLAELKERYPGLICVDYTHPQAVNANAGAYANAGLSYVVGTTGGDSAAMIRDAEEHEGVYAVIAPNMGRQIVAFQAMMELFAEQFPGALRGYSLQVVESHQSHKADTSGTAKAVVSSLQKLGLDNFAVDDIEKIRDPEESRRRLDVPQENLGGHAYHTYTVRGADGTVELAFTHNVRGRLVYAEGTVDAVQFLAERRSEGSEKRVYNMVDILRAGKL